MLYPKYVCYVCNFLCVVYMTLSGDLTVVFNFFPTEWCFGWRLSSQSFQLADSCNCYDEYPVYPHWPLSGNDRHHQGQPTAKVSPHYLLEELFTSLTNYTVSHLSSVLVTCSVFSEQRLYVSADPSSAECHPVCYRIVAVPYFPLKIHSQSPTLLPWLDFWVPWENEYVYQNVVGMSVLLSYIFSLWLQPQSKNR